jgi:hypothetical protein
MLGDETLGKGALDHLEDKDSESHCAWVTL